MLHLENQEQSLKVWLKLMKRHAMRVWAAYQHAEAVSDEEEVGHRDGVTIWLEHTLFIGRLRVHVNTHRYGNVFFTPPA